jgi:hypothetical protein
LAGTYDQHWLDNVFPFLPTDFKDEYYQAAPPDQQLPHPAGGEEVVLDNLSPEGHIGFRLPQRTIPVLFTRKAGDERAVEAVIDTLVIEPDLRRLAITWRTSIPLSKNIFEIRHVVAGEMPKGWHRARRVGKIYYASLGELINRRRRVSE